MGLLKRRPTAPVRIDAAALERLRCPRCVDATDDDAGTFEREENGARDENGVTCATCGAAYPVVDGILDLSASDGFRNIRRYHTEQLDDALAPAYRLVQPVMSLAAWRCSPLRFVDWANMAVGRAQDGWLLSLPVATGATLAHVWAPYLSARVIVADRSWQMLRRAQRNLGRAGIDALFVRTDVDRLPFATAAFDAVLSLHGLHGFENRAQSLSELWRVTHASGTLAGSALTRAGGRLADVVLDAYERRGVTPALRGKDLLLAELDEACAGARVLHEMYGSVLFFSATRIADA